MVVEGQGGKLLGEGAHLGRKSGGGCGVDVDEEVELSAAELAERNEVRDAFQEAGLAKRMDVGRRKGVMSRGAEHAGEGDHRTQRIAVGAEMARDEDALGLREEVLRGGKACAYVQLVHEGNIKP